MDMEFSQIAVLFVIGACAIATVGVLVGSVDPSRKVALIIAIWAVLLFGAIGVAQKRHELFIVILIIAGIAIIYARSGFGGASKTKRLPPTKSPSHEEGSDFWKIAQIVGFIAAIITIVTTVRACS